MVCFMWCWFCTSPQFGLEMSVKYNANDSWHFRIMYHLHYTNTYPIVWTEANPSMKFFFFQSLNFKLFHCVFHRIHTQGFRIFSSILCWWATEQACYIRKAKHWAVIKTVQKQLQVLTVLLPLVLNSVGNCSMYLLIGVLRKSSHRFRHEISLERKSDRFLSLH